MRDQILPDWYVGSALEIAARPVGARRRSIAPVRRALAGLGEALARELSSSPCAKSWLGGIEPRAKTVGVFVLIFGSTLLHSLWSLGALLAMVTLLALSIRLPAKRLARVWLGAPLFSLAIILPAATNLVTPGAAVLTLWRFGHVVTIGPWALPESIAVTGSGLVVAGRFLVRSVDCVTLAYLLIATTEPAALLGGLRRLGMPRVFGMVLTMAQCYLTVLLRAAEEIHLAKLSRTIAPGPLRGEQRWVAAGIGILFRRTHRLAQEVHLAMISRGCDGDLRLRHGQPPRARDFAWSIGAVALTAILVAVDRLRLGGLH